MEPDTVTIFAETSESAPDVKSDPRVDRALPIWLYGFMLFICSLLLTGYRVYYQSQAMELPIVFHQNDPSLYKDDPFVETLRFYATAFWRAVALGSRILPLEPLLLALFLFERLIGIYAAGRLAHAFSSGRTLAMVGAMAMMALGPHPIVGEGTITKDYLEHTALAVPFLLLAMAAFYQARRFWWAVWFAVGFNLNIMYGGFALAYFLAGFASDSRYRSEWKKWVYPALLLAALASPACVPALSAMGRTATDVSLWLAASRVRLPWHYYPLTWPTDSFIRFSFLALLLVGLLYQSRRQDRQLFLHGTAWTGVSVGWQIAAFAAAYLVRRPSVLIMQAARGSDLWYCLAGIALISLAAARLEESPHQRRFFTIAFLATVFFWHPMPAFVMLMGLMALLWEPVWKHGLREGRPGRLELLLAISVLLVASASVQKRLRLHDGGVFFSPPPADLRELADWARTATPVDATFLVDPTFDPSRDGFRVLARRPVFVTFRDGGAIQWDQTYVTEWAARLDALGCDIRPFQECDLPALYAKLGDDAVRRLKDRYPIAYWVVSVEHQSSFPVVFRNQHYRVLDVRDM